jgi:hypothetical protein
MKTEPKAKTKAAGMSSRDFQANLGLKVTPRQFRRYVKARLIPEKWIEKNAKGHFTFHPPANTKWSALRERIEQWRRLRYQRGWEVRPRADGSLNPRDKTRGIVTIHGLSQQMTLWLRKMWPEILEMEEKALMDIHFLLQDSANLSWWIERKCGTADKWERARLKAFRDFI